MYQCMYSEYTAEKEAAVTTKITHATVATEYSSICNKDLLPSCKYFAVCLLLCMYSNEVRHRMEKNYSLCQ